MINNFISANKLAKMLGIARSTLYVNYLQPYKEGKITEYHKIIDLYMNCDSNEKAEELLRLLEGMDNTNKGMIELETSCMRSEYKGETVHVCTKDMINKLYNEMAHLVVELCSKDVKLNKGIEKLDKIFEKYK